MLGALVAPQPAHPERAVPHSVSQRAQTSERCPVADVRVKSGAQPQHGHVGRPLRGADLPSSTYALDTRSTAFAITAAARRAPARTRSRGTGSLASQPAISGR